MTDDEQPAKKARGPDGNEASAGGAPPPPGGMQPLQFMGNMGMQQPPHQHMGPGPGPGSMGMGMPYGMPPPMGMMGMPPQHFTQQGCVTQAGGAAWGEGAACG